MGKQRPPRKLDAAAIKQCADIVGVQRRDIFGPELVKLVAGACRWGKNPPPSVTATRKARANIVKSGRIFAAALRKAPLNMKWEFEVALGLPYGTTGLDVILDAMTPLERFDALWARRFVVLLCTIVKKAGGELTHNEKENRGTLVDLLDALKFYLPAGFVPASPNILRRLKEEGANLALHVSAVTRH